MYSEQLEKIYNALTPNVFQPKFYGESDDAHVTIPLQPPIIMNNNPFTITLINFNFVNAMPNIKTGINDKIIYGSDVITIPQGRYSFKNIFDIMPEGLTFELNTIEGKIKMTSDETITQTNLLLYNFGFTQEIYPVGTHIAENVASIDEYNRFHLICDEVLNETAGLKGNTNIVYSQALSNQHNYATIELFKSGENNATIAPTDRLSYLHFHLIDNNGNILDFGNHKSEFQIFGAINRH